MFLLQKNMFPYRICGNQKLLANNQWTRVRYRYNQCFWLPFVASRVTNGNQKLGFFTIFGLRSPIILTFSIAEYLVWIRCTLHGVTVDIFCIQLNKIFWDCLCLKGRYITMTVGAQWLSGRVLDSRPKGRGFEPHRRHCVVVLEQDTFILA